MKKILKAAQLHLAAFVSLMNRQHSVAVTRTFWKHEKRHFVLPKLVIDYGQI